MVFKQWGGSYLNPTTPQSKVYLFKYLHSTLPFGVFRLEAFLQIPPMAEPCKLKEGSGLEDSWVQPSNSTIKTAVYSKLTIKKSPVGKKQTE